MSAQSVVTKIWNEIEVCLGTVEEFLKFTEGEEYQKLSMDDVSDLSGKICVVHDKMISLSQFFVENFSRNRGEITDEEIKRAHSLCRRIAQANGGYLQWIRNH